MATYVPNQLYQVPLAERQPDPAQPLKYLDLYKSKATISESLSLNRLPPAIRDACRQDPTVPKNVLVEIARKKQERDMLTQYNYYLGTRTLLPEIKGQMNLILLLEFKWEWW